jgi:hypothetical protein
MEAFARAASRPTTVYLVGGTTAVLLGWRESTIDVDFVVQPDDNALLRSLPALKDSLEVNLELASPLDFIPVPEGWEDRNPLVRRIGDVLFRHFDPYAQVLAKLERGHAQERFIAVSPRSVARRRRRCRVVPANWTLDIPDLTAGYDAAWRLKNWSADWQVTAVGGDVLPLLGAAPFDGARLTTAGMNSPSRSQSRRLRFHRW